MEDERDKYGTGIGGRERKNKVQRSLRLDSRMQIWTEKWVATAVSLFRFFLE